jgi:hypothetical protein
LIQSDFKPVWYCEQEDEGTRINYELWVKDEMWLSCYIVTEQEMPLELLPEALEYLENYAMSQLQPANDLPV